MLSVEISNEAHIFFFFIMDVNVGQLGLTSTFKVLGLYESDLNSNKWLF